MASVAPFLTLSAAIAVVLGAHVHRPAAPGPWRLVALGLAVCALPGFLGRIVAPLYLVGELAIAAGFVLLGRRRHGRLSRAAAIDAAIIALGCGAIGWLFLLEPYLDTARHAGIAAIWAPVSGAADVALVAAAALLVLGALREGRAAILLALATASLVGSHATFLWATLHGGGHSRAGLEVLAWIVFCGLLAAAALTPAMTRLSEPAARRDTGLTGGRLALFAGTSLVTPAVAILAAVRHEHGHVLINAISGVIFLLVLLRVAGLVREHEALAAASLRGRFEDRLGSIVRNASDMVAVVEGDGRVGYASPSALRLLGMTQEEVAGLDWRGLVHPDDGAALGRFLDGLGPGGSGQVECRVRDADGGWRDIEAQATDLTGDGAVDGVVLNARDITDRKRLERRLQHQASHDTLTGLPNRTLLRDRVERALARRRRSGRPLAVVFLDLDDFKNVNDTLGHAGGDELLREVARRLDGCIRAGDTATRMGGDEFAVLVDDLEDESDAVAAAERILAALAEPALIAGRLVEPAGSLGIAFATQGRETADELLRDADAAMYLAKDRGKGSYAIFEPAMHAAAVDRVQLRRDLAQAIADGDVTLAYQPVVDLRSGEIRAYESLARWTHPVRGVVAPCTFIPLAEESGLIVDLGRALLRRACRETAEFHGVCTVGAPLRVSVNVSARQLASDAFVGDVRAAVRDAGIRPRDLILEVTESTMMQDVELAAARLGELRAFGVGLAVDDFGTGYSSLNSLRSFPVDRLKIDRSFVAALDDPRTRALTEMIVELGGLMEMLVVAEGVEDEAGMRAVLELGCPFAQGFGLQRPMPAADVRDHLARHGRWVTLPTAAPAAR